MRGTRALLGALGAVALGVAGLSGCRTPSGAARDRPAGAAVSSSGYGAEFLAVGECGSFGTTNSTEVPCTSERAAARVVARYDGNPSDGPACPATTDFVLHITEPGPAADGDGDGAVAHGYACMRNLEPPHPGDPGGGGGPRTVVGDCVYGAGRGEVRETACAGRGAHPPEYKVTSAVRRRAQCPSSTVLYVQLGGDRPVGCARRV